MPDKTINELEVGTTLAGTERVPMWQNGTFYTTLTAIKNFALNLYAGSGTITTVGTVTTGTWSAKFAARVVSGTTATTITPNADTTDAHVLTALASSLTIANPVGSPVNFQVLKIRLKDNGTNRALTFGTKYRFSLGLTAPSNTIANETLYLEFVYNDADDKWDCVENLGGF